MTIINSYIKTTLQNPISDDRAEGINVGLIGELKLKKIFSKP